MQRLKKHESPRSMGRNSNGKVKPVAQRQAKARTKALLKRLKETS